jgi:hypothetical protein
MQIERYLERFQYVETGLPRSREAQLVAGILVVGMTFVSPSFAALVVGFDIPVPIPLLVGLAAVGILYGVFVLLIGRVVLGVVVGLIVTSTYAANVPLTATVRAYPGQIGPDIWLAQLPIIALVAFFVLADEYSIRASGPTGLVFGGFVIWTVVSAFFGAVPRVDTALYYSVLALTSWLAFSLIACGVENSIVTLREVASIYVVTMAGHVLFATLQILNRGSFGFTFLGETNRAPGGALIDLGPLGSYAAGVFVTGFTGSSGIITSLIILVSPVAVSVALGARGERFDLLSLFTLSAIVLRFTRKDAARMSFILTLVLFCSVVGYQLRDGLTRFFRTKEKLIASLGSIVMSGLLMFYPVMAPPSSSGGGGSEGSGSGSGGTGGGSNGGGFGAPGSTYAEIQDIAVRTFNLDLSTLGTRLQQYIAGVDLFVRYPFFGIGGGNFMYVSNAVYSIPVSFDGQPVAMHNLYIGLLAETGGPGFLFYVGAVGLVLYRAWLLATESQYTTDGIIAVGMMGGLIGYLANAFWDVSSITFTGQVPFWIMAGTVVGQYHANTEGVDKESREIISKLPGIR